MDIEFHYWLTGIVAYRAGFSKDDALTIAYASEYVDENDISYSVIDRRNNSEYVNFMSQTMNIMKPKDSLMRIYPIFHFVPGDPMAASARRRDGKMHLLNTTPNNEHANAVIDDAFKASEDTRLYRIGIASHSFVDTWAHQNFIGWYDHFNEVALKPIPAIGHAPAEHHPDWVNYVWIDNRLVDGEISNRNRFIDAAKALYTKYCQYQKTQGNVDLSSKWDELEKELITITGQTYTGSEQRYQDDRLKSYKNRLTWFPDFDETNWFNEAIDTIVRGVLDKTDGLLSDFTLFKDKHYWKDGIDREKTHWYRFQEAVKEQERLGIKLLSGRFKDMGYDLAVV